MPLIGNSHIATDLIHNNNYVWKAYHGSDLVYEPSEVLIIEVNNSNTELLLNLLDTIPIARQIIAVSKDNLNNVIEEVKLLLNDTIQSLNITGADRVFFKLHFPSFKSIDFLKIEGSDFGITSVNALPFSNLTRLHIKDQANLTSIDITANTQLEYLELDFNNLSSIDISGLSNLNTIKADNNSISSLDLSDAILLKFLEIDNNNLSSIDLSINEDLLWCLLSGNNLSSLSLTNNINIVWLRVFDNNLSTLSTSTLTQLTRLEAKQNTLTSLNFTNNNLLEILDIGENNLSSLNISNLVLLKTLFISDNPTGNIDLSNNILLESIQISGNNLTSLDISMLPNLVTLDCSANENLTTLDISDNDSLMDLRCAECDFTADDADPSIIDAIIIKMDTNIVTGGVLYYDTIIPGGVQPSLASLSAYNSLVLKGCNIRGKVPA